MTTDLQETHFSSNISYTVRCTKLQSSNTKALTHIATVSLSCSSTVSFIEINVKIASYLNHYINE